MSDKPSGALPWSQTQSVLDPCHEAAFGLALNILSRRDHFRNELGRKLESKECDPDSIEAVLDHCEALGYLNDWENAQRFAHYLMESKRQGPYKIVNTLKKRGASSDLAAKVVDKLANYDDWVKLARNLHQDRFGSPPKDRKSQRRQRDFLMRRGFSFEVIESVLPRF